MAKILNLVDTKMLERMQTPVNKILGSLDSDMQSVLQRSDMSDVEKVQAYNQILQKYLEYYRPHKVVTETRKENQEENKLDDYVIKEVLNTIPISMKKRAEALLHRIKIHPDTSWNDRGEFIYQGRVLPGSNIVDLVHDMIRDRKSFKARGRLDFARALRQTNVPQHLVGNKKIWEWMHRPTASSDAFSTANEQSFSDGESGAESDATSDAEPGSEPGAVRRHKSNDNKKTKRRRKQMRWESQ